MKLPAVKRDRSFHLRIFRATYNLSKYEAAKLLGIGPSHWSLLERGRRNASPSLAAKLAAMTGEPLELFLGIKVTR